MATETRTWPAIFGNHLDRFPPPCKVCADPEWEVKATFVSVPRLCNEHRRLAKAQLDAARGPGSEGE